MNRPTAGSFEMLIMASFSHPGYPSITSCSGTTSTQGEGSSGDIESSFFLTNATTFNFLEVVNQFFISYDILN
jgi:hypothetical protein